MLYPLGHVGVILESEKHSLKISPGLRLTNTFLSQVPDPQRLVPGR